MLVNHNTKTNTTNTKTTNTNTTIDSISKVDTDRLLVVSVGGLMVNLVGIFAFHDAHAHAHGGGGCGGGHGHRWRREKKRDTEVGISTEMR